jgi:hypothetical protein
MKRFLIASIVVGYALMGCGQEEQQVDMPPDTAKLEGTVRKELVGTWKTADGSSTITLKEDGSSVSETNVFVRGKAQVSKAEGPWLATEKSLGFERKQPSGETFVARYDYKFPKKDSLDLSILGGKNKLTYKRQ